ncbi:hypothetical protein CVT24_010210 [Panaeolus cyanescens]|uniref:Uncharacterized protein n=1 Tax=Panaeolus cyanescens TaxID=181874 RepID=A0A409YPT6_9AGAR|nr:hypothetical protein CVT24_010210 [Panaeolus cyanescens]
MPTHGTLPVAQADPPTSEAARTLKENELLPSKVDPIVKSRTEALKTLKNANFIQKADDVKTIRLLANALFLFAAEPQKGQKRLDSSPPDRSFLEALGRILLGFALDPQEQVRTYIHEALETFADEVKATVREQCDKVILVTTETNSNVASLANETLQVSSTVRKSAEDVARTYCMVAAAPAATHIASPHFVQRPQVLNKQDKFDRQIMLKLNEDNPLLSPDLSDDDVVRQVQEALGSLDTDRTHDTSLVSASRKSPRKDTVLLELKSRLTATWIRGEDRTIALATRLGAVVQDRTYQVMVRRIPLTFDEEIRSPEAPARIADENKLDPSVVKSVRWIKPAERRSEDQRSAYAMISLTTPQAANCLIRDGVFLNEKHWHRPAVRSTKDAPRCLKCQHYGHLAKDCPNAETCGTCGAAHPTRGCKKLSTPWCVSCKSNNHSSWDRECPVFIAESRKLVRNNENDYIYFPTEEPWTWALKSNSGAAPPPPPPAGPQVQQRIAYRNNVTQGERKRQNKGKHRAPPTQSSQDATQSSHPPFLTAPNTVPFPSPGTGPSKWPMTLPIDNRPLPPLGQPYDPNIDWSEHPEFAPPPSPSPNERQNHAESNTSWDLVLIQEPNINFYNHITTARGFRQVYPNARMRNEKVVRSGIWVNEKISTNMWRALEVEDTADITAVQLSGPHYSLTVFSIYNDCNNSDAEKALGRFMSRNSDTLLGNGGHVLWGGDFNRHHPLWDNDEDHRLFTSQAISDAERLIQLLAEWNMEMALPKGIRTLEHMRTKNLSRPDNMFCTDHTSHRIIKCDTVPELRPTNTDHLPIGTILDMEKVEITQERRRNFKLTDWDAFNADLTRILSPLDTLSDLLTPVAFDHQVDALSSAIGEAIEANTPYCTYTKYTKRWWSKELSQMRDQKQKLAWLHAKHASDKDHPVHDEYRKTRNRYGEAILQAKEEHWRAFLEEATEREMWVANGYIRAPVGDAGRVRMPTLRTNENGTEVALDTNESKAEKLAQVFFPMRPRDDEQAAPPLHAYPPSLQPSLPLTAERVANQIRRTSPLKAPGPDGIPNLVFQKCTDTLSPILAQIFNAAIRLGRYHHSWKVSITCVLRKPGKPSYEAPKAYRPIALLSTTAKLLSALVAEDMSRLIEEHKLLPSTHFGGRPGRTTSDALHYLVNKVKSAWRADKVVSVLFLDVEGAFPNAVTEKVLHNMRKRRMPTEYVELVANMLEGRSTQLKFDDYTSAPKLIDNGIGQGCPLSMILYIIYNADLLEIPSGDGEDAIGYVDDALFIAVADTFDETVAKLEQMMTRQGGGCQWSRSHNSSFEMSKVAVMHFSRRHTGGADGAEKTNLRDAAPPLIINGNTISVVEEYKYLGILVDPELRWKQQTARASEKAAKWILLFKRLTNSQKGMNSKLMRHLYRAVGIPKLTYALDVWYEPPNKPDGARNAKGSVRALRQIITVQKTATLAITGALKGTAADVLDPHAKVLPAEALLWYVCKRAYLRLCTLPRDHILSQTIADAHSNRTKKLRHASPLEKMAVLFDVNPNATEKIPAVKPRYDLGRYLTTLSFPSREDSIAHEKADNARVKLFTDGSGQDGHVGAAASIYLNDMTNPATTRHLYMGTIDSHSTYEAELVGLLLAVWLLITEAGHVLGRQPISVYTDNQSVLEALTSQSRGPAEYLKDEIARLCAKYFPNDSPFSHKISVNWISAHSDVTGNERIDFEAKQAAMGLTSRRQDLPRILRSPLPRSISALRQELKREAKEKAHVIIKASPRWPQFKDLETDYDFSNFHKAADKMDRYKASILVKIRTRHFPLNDYLHKRKIVQSNACEQCGAGARESLRHYLLECTKYSGQRNDLWTKLGRRYENVDDLLTNPERATALVEYVDDTGRFPRRQTNLLQDSEAN